MLGFKLNIFANPSLFASFSFVQILLNFVIAYLFDMHHQFHVFVVRRCGTVVQMNCDSMIPLIQDRTVQPLKWLQPNILWTTARMSPGWRHVQVKTDVDNKLELVMVAYLPMTVLHILLVPFRDKK